MHYYQAALLIALVSVVSTKLNQPSIEKITNTPTKGNDDRLIEDVLGQLAEKTTTITTTVSSIDDDNIYPAADWIRRNTAPIHRLRASKSRKHTFITDVDERRELINSGWRAEAGCAGRLLRPERGDVMKLVCPSLLPLHSALSPNGIRVLSTSTREDLLSSDHTTVTLAGWCTSKPECGAAASLQSFWDNIRKEHLYIWDDVRAAALHNSTDANAESALCYIWSRCNRNPVQI